MGRIRIQDNLHLFHVAVVESEDIGHIAERFDVIVRVAAIINYSRLMPSVLTLSGKK